MKNIGYSDFIQNNMEEIHSTATHKSFLGREFLTWLWFFTESEEGGQFEISTEIHGKVTAQIHIDDRIVLSSKVGLSHDLTIKGGNPSQCQEAALALRHGKSVCELRMSIDMGEAGLFSLTLAGDDLSPKSVHLPEVRDDVDASPIEQRLRSTLNLATAIDQLFIKFMDERSSKVWETEKLESIRTWIKTRAQERDGVIH